MTTWAGAGGLSFLQFCNLNSFRTKFILGFSFFMGLSIPQYFNEYTAVNGYGPVHTGARWVTNYVPWTLLFFFLYVHLLFVWSLLVWQFNDMINVPFSSEPFVAGLLAYVLDVTLHKKDNATRKDRGMHWWDRFRSFKTDTRSEEFYSLPFNLNKFFPSVWLYAQVRLSQHLFVGVALLSNAGSFWFLVSHERTYWVQIHIFVNKINPSSLILLL